MIQGRSKGVVSKSDEGDDHSGRRTMCSKRQKVNQEVVFDFIPDRRGLKMQWSC